MVRANLFAEPTGLDAGYADKLMLDRFDTRPYLPQDHGTALFSVLKKAEQLAGISDKQAVSYQNHDWTAASEIENIECGLESARAIWLLFRGAGLPFSEGETCPSLAAMADPRGPMARYGAVWRGTSKRYQ